MEPVEAPAAGLDVRGRIKLIVDRQREDHSQVPYVRKYINYVLSDNNVSGL